MGNADLGLGRAGCAGYFKFLTYAFQMMQRLFPSELKFCFVLFGFKSSQASFGSWNLNNVEEHELCSRNLRQFERTIDGSRSFQIDGDQDRSKLRHLALRNC